MTEREQLIKLLDGHSLDQRADVEFVADFLLDNGVRLPVTCGECKNADEKAYFCNIARGNSSWGMCTYPEGYCDSGERRC